MPKPLSVYYKVASVSYFFIIHKACAVSSLEVLLKMNIEPHGGRGGRHQCSDFFFFLQNFLLVVDNNRIQFRS